MRDIHELRQKHANGAAIEFLYFWGHTPPENGEVNHACLSQWYPSPFTIDGVVYPTAEHWMMASKARLFGDFATLAEIRATISPQDAKAAGRKVRDFDEARWEAHRFRFVVDGNWAKFTQNHTLRQYLLGTGTKVLIEASPTDHIWGIGLSEQEARNSYPEHWPGLNLLGFALMEVREQISEFTF